VMQLLEKNPAKRPQSALEVQRRLQRLEDPFRSFDEPRQKPNPFGQTPFGHTPASVSLSSVDPLSEEGDHNTGIIEGLDRPSSGRMWASVAALCVVIFVLTIWLVR